MFVRIARLHITSQPRNTARWNQIVTTGAASSHVFYQLIHSCTHKFATEGPFAAGSSILCTLPQVSLGAYYSTGRVSTHTRVPSSVSFIMSTSFWENPNFRTVSEEDEARIALAAKEIGLDPQYLLPEEDRLAHYAKARQFYNSIGAPKTVCAPMVNQSHILFRELVRRYGTELCYTPMIHAAGYIRHYKGRSRAFSTAEGDRPLFAQLCVDDPDTLVEAALMIANQVDAIDMNFGCPQQIARRGHYGAFLLEEPRLIQRIVRTLHDKLPIPVTVKMRMLLNDPDGYKTIALARALQDCGASVLTIHGRTRENLKQRIGPSDTNVIRRVKAALSIPVFANGGIGTFEDVRRTLVETGVDGIMSSEALLTWPALFASEHPKPDLHALVRRAQRRLNLPVMQTGFEDESDGAESKMDPHEMAELDARTPPTSVICMPNAVEMAHELLEIAQKYPEFDRCVRPHLFKILFRELAIHTDVRRYISGQSLLLRVAPRQLRKAQCIAFVRHLRNPDLPLIQTVPIFAADGSMSFTAVVGKMSTSDGESEDTDEQDDNCNPCSDVGTSTEEKRDPSENRVHVDDLPKDAAGRPVVTEDMPIPIGMSKSLFKKLVRKFQVIPKFHTQLANSKLTVQIEDDELDLSDPETQRILDEGIPILEVVKDGSTPAEMRRIMRCQEFYIFLDRLYSQCPFWYVRHLTRKDWSGRMEVSSVKCLEGVTRALTTSAASSYLYPEILAGTVSVADIANSIKSRAEAYASELHAEESMDSQEPSSSTDAGAKRASPLSDVDLQEQSGAEGTKKVKPDEE